MILHTRHVLAVNDLSRSADHYINVLGFKRDFAVEGWEFLSLDGFRVMLGECPDEVPAAQTNNHSWYAYVTVDSVDALFERMKEKGATILQTPRDKEWQMREFVLRTIDGHRIVFGEELS